LTFPYNHDFDDHVYFKGGGFGECHIKEGDLVLCLTNPAHDWAIGFVHEVYDQNHLMIREIGGNRVCEVYNESFAIIRGMPDLEILDGDRYEFRRKVIKAFKWGDEFPHRFSHIEFDGTDAVIWVRFAWGTGDPFSIPITWDNRTTIKSILAHMREHGYGTRGLKERPSIMDISE